MPENTQTIIVSPLASKTSDVEQVHRIDDAVVDAVSAKAGKKIKVGRSKARDKQEAPKVIRNVRKSRRMHRIIKIDDLEPGEVNSFSTETGYGFLETAKGHLYFHSASQRTCVIRGDEIVLSDENPSVNSSPEKEPDHWITVKPKKQKPRTIYVDPRMKIGTRVLFFRKNVPDKRSKNGNQRESAVSWCIQDDYFAARKKLIERPVFRLLRRWIEYGTPVADNDKKEFVAPETNHEDEIFNGADLEELKYVLRKNPLNNAFKHTNGQMVECQWQWQRNVNGHWHNCGHPLETDPDYA